MPWEKTYLGVIESFLADTRVFRQRLSSISRITKSASKHIGDMERLLARLRCFSNGFEGISTGREQRAPAGAGLSDFAEQYGSGGQPWYSEDPDDSLQEGDELSGMSGSDDDESDGYGEGVMGPDGIRTI